MNRSVLQVFAIAIALFITPSRSNTAFAQRCVALVIGNSSYRNAPYLPNPIKDAAAMAAKFKDAGYEVHDFYNLGNLEFKRRIREFEAGDADMIVVYFAGHGIEVDGVNYVVPVDAKLANTRDAPEEAVPLDRLVDAVDGAKKLSLVILDACRDNRFVKMKGRFAANTASVHAGLSPFQPNTPNTLIAFATKTGTCAKDGNDDHSPFTAALLQHLFVQGLDIRLAFGRVRDDVLKKTGNRQEPYVAGSIGGETIALVCAPSIDWNEEDVKTREAKKREAPQEREAKAAEEARQKAERAENLKRAEEERKAQAVEKARKKAEREAARKQERQAKAAEATRLKAERETALKREEEEKRDKAAAEAERARAKRGRKREEEERQAKAAEVDSRDASSDVPQFPWPPPAASASYVLPRGLFEDHSTIGHVATLILSALDRRGYVERSFFGAGADGVALVTRLERISDDGSPAVESERWPGTWVKMDPKRGLTTTELAKLLSGLFFVQPGRYRVIVFIFQYMPFSQSRQDVTRDTAYKWLHEGLNVLPREMAERSFDEGDCTALVYEFASYGSAVSRVASNLTGMQHLEKAGVLALLQAK
jgi:uncharacterized caspase-like protein